MNWKDRIVSDPEVLVGKPAVKGTRLSVEFLLGLKGAGWSDEQIIENYPHLSVDDLQAVFAFAAALIKDEDFIPLEMVQ